MNGDPPDEAYKEWLDQGRKIGLHLIHSVRLETSPLAVSDLQSEAEAWKAQLATLKIAEHQLRGMTAADLWRRLVNRTSALNDFNVASDFRAMWDRLADRGLHLKDVDPAHVRLPRSEHDVLNAWPTMPVRTAGKIAHYCLLPQIVAQLSNGELLDIPRLGQKGIDKIRELYS